MARIVFFGNERLATGVTSSVASLKALVAAGHDIVAVVANNQASSSRSARELEIQTVAREHHIPVLLPQRPTDITDNLKAMNADIGVLVAYGRIVPQSIIDIFPHGIINLHPSLLPLHRGPIPIESVILEGAAQTGVSVMQLVREMDAGPVWTQQAVKLTGRESKQDLADQLLATGAQTIVETLPTILSGELRPIDQDNTKATIDSRLTKAYGQLDFTKSRHQLEREIRAYLGWPGSRTSIAGRDVIVTAAHSTGGTIIKPGTVHAVGGDLLIATSDGYLAIDRLKPAGKREMSARDFIAGISELR